MINLRYHIVSITAVFLALGIGLTLGSTFLDRVTVDNLKSQLDTVQERVDETESRNGELSARVGALESRDEELAVDLAERIVAGHLDGVPVVVVASEGSDEELVQLTLATLQGAGAEVAGTWWLTNRWLLDDPEEVEQLADVLDLSSDDPERLRRNASVQLADAMLEASRADPVEDAPTVDADTTGPEAEGTGGDPTGGDPATTTTTEVPQPTEPELAAALSEAGFIEYDDLPDGGDRVLLPPHAARFVFVSGADPGNGSHLMEVALLEELAADGPAPVVAAQGEADLRTEDGEPASEEARRTSFVGPVREGELTGQWVSTVDTLDSAAGQVALVLAVEDLAVEDLASARTGHYGVAPGASRLLPGPVASQ